MKKKRQILPFLFFSALCAVTLFPPAVVADEATEARFHFQRGIELFKQSKLQLALEQFLLSNRLVKNANAVFNAGKCFEKLNKFNEAYALYSEYLLFELEEDDRSDGEQRLADVEKQVATIHIESAPEGAEIFLDRKDLGSWGTTPRIIAVPPGSHELIVEMKNHHPSTIHVVAVIGELKKINVDLIVRKGTLKVKAPYDTASLSIDEGEKKNVELPAVMELPAGEHTLKIEVEGYIPEERLIEVKEGEATHVEFVLTDIPPPMGSMNIVSSPASALVKLDGEEFGFTPIIKDAQSGSHSVLVQLDGMQSWKGKFDLAKDDSLFLTVDMVPEGIPKKHKRGQRAFWVMGGIFMGSGIVAGGLALAAKRKFNEEPTKELVERGRLLNIATDGSFVLGAVFILTGTIWYLLARRTAKLKTKGEFSYKKAEIDYTIEETQKP